MLIFKNSTPDKSKAGVNKYVKLDNVQMNKKLFCSIHIKDALSENEYKNSNKTLSSATNDASESTAFSQKVR